MTPSKRKGVRVEPEEPTNEGAPSPWDNTELNLGEELFVEESPSMNPTAQRIAMPRTITTKDPTGYHPAMEPAIARAPTAKDTSLPPKPASNDDAYLAPGTQLGEYRVEAKIGEGGMGVVYSAVHPLIGKRAAVKVLKAELCRSAFNVERFIDEARIVNQIGHQNIVDVFSFGKTADGRSYFVMEWLRGESLRARVAHSRLDLDEICDVIKPLARALEAAHEAGIIHRDLKPDNIFLVDVRGEAPLVKLLDFGIAKLAREEHRMERTATGAMVGTPQYIAPEQAKGYAIDHRVDIYALGGILFELITGRPPFVADNAMEMVAKHLMEPPPRASGFGHVPPELDDLVFRMLSKDPNGRPSLAEVATVIERTSALDRTNVKTPIAPAPESGPTSEPIHVPTPTPQSSPNLRGGHALRQSAPARLTPIPQSTSGLNPALSQALANAMATPGAVSAQQPLSATEMTETIRAPEPASRKKGVLLPFLAFVLAAGAAYAVVSIVGANDTEERAGEAVQSPAPPPNVEPAPEQPQPAQPAVEPPKTQAPAVEPVKTEPVKTEPVKPAPVKQKTEPVKPKTAPPPPKKKTNRLELTILGGKDTPKILIDGKAAGPTTELSIGTHQVEVTSTGFKPQRFSVIIGEDKPTKRGVVLEAIPTNPDLLPPGALDNIRTDTKKK